MPNHYSVRVQSTPQRLEQVGPLIPGWLSRHDDELGRRMPGEFLLDTGAYGAMIDADVAAAALGLTVRGTREVHGIHGYGVLQVYLARLVLAAKDPQGKECLFDQLIECVGVPALMQKSRENDAQVIGILGRMFLRSAVLNIDSSSGTVSLVIQR
jgi:hypothetical protein